MTTDPYIAKFLKAIGKHKLLTFERECQLSEIIQSRRPHDKEYETGKLPHVSTWGCKEAVGEFAKANLCLIVHNAKRYESPDHTFWDFYQEGVFGLLDAIARYDGTKGYRFSTYATFYIRRAMTRLLCKGVITVPPGFHSAMQKRRRLYGELCIELGRKPTENELMRRCVAEGAFDSERCYQNSLLVSPRVVSGDTILKDNGDYTIFDTIASNNDDDELCQKALKDAVNDALETLPPLTREVIQLNYGIGYDREPTRRIAERYNVEKRFVKTLKTKGMRQLRRPQTLATLTFVR
jgi:RNA polymerase sigma factor (sigma-70 family)